MLKIIRLFWGYVVFAVSGAFPERFMNLTARAGISLFDVKKRGEVLYCSAMASEYKTLKKLSKKSSVEIKIKEKHGLPFFIKKYKKRKGIFLGIICFGIVLYFFSLYVWSIDISGNNTIDNQTLITLMKSLGVEVGTLKSEIDIPIIEKNIMNKFENISWASVNIKGSTLNLELKERVDPPELIPKSKPCNVKSSKDGQIVRMEIYEGTPEINNGDAVVKGQLLVNGIVEDDFGVCNIKHADAKIYALTKHELKKEVDLCETKKVFTGKNIVRKRLKLFGIELPLTLVAIPGKDYEKNIYINNVKVNNVSLPVTYYKEVWSQFYNKKETLTKEEAKNKAMAELEQEEKKEFKDMKIINRYITKKEQNSKVIIIANYTCEENIAVCEEINVEQ